MNMTKSQILSSNDKQQIILTLNGFLNGQIEFSRMLSIIQKYIDVDFSLAPTQREIKENLLDGILEIQVASHHVSNMLKKYLRHELSASELSDWAAFIFLAQVFVPEGETEEARWLSGDGPTWDILQRLMNPECFDGLDQAVAQQYIDMLAS